MIAQFFETNKIVVHFVYPLIFFLMGFGILLKNTVLSNFNLAKSLQYLAVFGVLHGIADWGNIFIPLQKTYLSDNYIFILQSIKTILNATSFFFFFYFGIHLLVQTKKLNRKLLFLPILMLLIWLVDFIILEPIFVNESNHEWWFALSDIWARYLLAFPGGCVSSYALYLQREQFENLGEPSIILLLMFAVGSVGLYSLTGGIIVPYAPVSPAVFFNSELFLRATGIPVELFRALSGGLMAIFILQILKVFDIEYHHYFSQAEKQKAVMEERIKIARDLHDGIIQSIYANGLHLEKIRTLLKNEGKTEEAEIELAGVIRKLNELIREIRGYIKNLKMLVTAQADLKLNIEHLLQEIENDGLEVELRYEYGGTGDLPLAKSVQIYYIIKEALSNVLRHAEASKVILTVKGDEADLFIEVADNGKGIVPGNGCLEGEESDFFKQGIKNMKSRARSIGGSLLITSVTNCGTKVSLHVPLE